MAGNDNDLLKIQRPNGRDPEADKTAHDNEMAKLNEQEKALNKNIADMQQYLALKAQFQSNTTIGRIKSLQCSRDEPPPASAPPPARHEVRAWDGVVRGSPAEEYVKNARGGLDAVHGDTWHFQQSQNFQDAEIGVTIDAALGKLLQLGGRLIAAVVRKVKPAAPTPAPAAAKPASSGDGLYVAKPSGRNRVGKAPLRQAYEVEVRAFEDIGLNARAAGATDEQTARLLHQMRRDLGVEYKGMTPPAELERIYERNLRDYGDKLGPTIDYLRDVKGKTWEQIIESAARPGGKNLGY